jgi:hypothetical protein
MFMRNFKKIKIITLQIGDSHGSEDVDDFFWVVMPCGLLGGYQHFGRTYCFHHQP